MPGGAVAEGDLLWEPSAERRAQANLSLYLAYLKESCGLVFDGYPDLWQWSATCIEEFWASIWSFYDLRSSHPWATVLAERKMPGAEWFPGARLNYAEHVFARATSERPALIFQSEAQPLTEISWERLRREVAAVARALRSMGVRPGDRIAAYLPNIPEAVVAFLAAASLGAVWSSCSPDFGSRSVIDRFRQIEPKVLFAVDGYRYGGKEFDRRGVLAELRAALASLQATVLVAGLEWRGRAEGVPGAVAWSDLVAGGGDLGFERLPFDHPLWIVYSSGTTGAPKGLVHGHGGILVEFLKFLGLHLDVKPGERFFWFSTTGWVMWNILQGALLLGATPILYDGSPAYPTMDVLWELAEKTRMTVFGTSAAYIAASMAAGLEPGRTHDLAALRTVGSTGSPLAPHGFQWIYEHVKRDVLVGSVSGGTDVCTAFVGSCPLLPVRAGELQCRCLGVKAEAFDEAGRSLVDSVGELVITEPMPSMPLFLWNDPEGERYRQTYFQTYPGVWQHGDWIKITRQGGAVIYGRSDSTLNRLGVRIGSAEIYGALEDVPEIIDSLVIGIEGPAGSYYMPLFVVLREGVGLDESLKAKIEERIRRALSPRHVPDEVFAAPDIPRTLNGKKLEVPVKRILMGMPAEKAVNADSMANPDSLAFFTGLAKRLESRRRGCKGAPA